MSPSEVTAVVLAGGLGTRLRHVLPDLPKPLAPVAGKPFIEWVLRYLAKQEVCRVIISTGHLGEKIEKYFEGMVLDNMSLRCAREPAPLGTAGGFLNAALSSEDSPAAWLVLNGDSLMLADLKSLFRTFDVGSCDAALFGRRVEDASRYGTLRTAKDSQLVSFSEKKSGGGIINAGVYLFRAALIPECSSQRPLNFEQHVFPSLLDQAKRIQVVETDGPFLDIGTEQSLREAAGFILQNRGWFLHS